MKNSVLFVLMLTAFSAIAQQPAATRTSIANGNATNPFIWDCTCLPLPGDNIIINSDVILDTDWAYSSGSFTINAGKSLMGNSTDRIFVINGGAFYNDGIVDIAYMYHSGGIFVNSGTLTVSQSFANASGVNTKNQSIMTISDSLYIVGTFTNTNTASAYATAVSGVFVNSGGFTTGDLWSSGSVNNSGLPGLEITHDIYNSGLLNNYSTMHVANDIWNSETFFNSNYVIIDHSLYTGDSVELDAYFTNDGLVSIAFDFYNNQTVDGTGDVCIGQFSANSGVISGTLDICDLTGGALDFNSGTVLGSVTFCADGPCAVSVEEEIKQEIKVYPNPFESRLTVIVEGYDDAKFVLQNILGQKVFSQNINGKTEIAVTEFESGVYFYTVVSEGKIVSNGKLLKE